MKIASLPRWLQPIVRFVFKDGISSALHGLVVLSAFLVPGLLLDPLAGIVLGQYAFALYAFREGGDSERLPDKHYDTAPDLWSPFLATVIGLAILTPMLPGY